MRIFSRVGISLMVLATIAATVVVKASPPVASLKKMAGQFQKAQRDELKALTHRQQFELKDLKASQSARLKEWKEKETQARRDFFKANAKSPVRRQFMRESKERYDAFLGILKDEWKSRARDLEVRHQSLIEEQRVKGEEFDKFIKKGEVPPESLWPVGGR